MKKITLILSVLLIWGCSQAEDEASTKEAVKAEVAEVKEAVVSDAEAVKDAAVAEVAEQVESVKNDAVDDVKKEVAAVAENAVEAVEKQVEKAKWQAGIHYSVINPAYETNSEDQVIVYEFFSYMCAHCASFEPFMHKLEKELPEHAKVVRVPVVFYPQWQPAAQAYYTFEAMGIADKAHEAMFQAIHQHKKQFRSIEDIASWAAGSFSVDKDKFLSTAKSFMVDGQLRKGAQMMQAMGISSTPTLITNGKYVPNTKAFKSRTDILDVTQYLVAMEAENMGLAK